jgi:prepilin-type N-terminal cleavage/methylation domain-containing protein
MGERGFTLVESVVALAVLTIALMGVARVAAEGVRAIAAATRLARSLEVIEDVSATGADDGHARGCEVAVSSASAAIAWRWVEVRCRRAEAAGPAGDGGEIDSSHGLAAGDREVGRLILVPS